MGNNGILWCVKEIIELDYNNFMKYVIFKCDWFDVINPNSGGKMDEYGFTLIMLSYHEMNITLLVSQVRCVFYVEDSLEKDWHVANLTYITWGKRFKSR